MSSMVLDKTDFRSENVVQMKTKKAHKENYHKMSWFEAAVVYFFLI